MKCAPFFCLALLLIGSVPAVASAQTARMNRCTDPQGGSVYTDRPCETLGARPRMPVPAPAPAPAQVTGTVQDRNTLGARCPRRLSELVNALRAAAGSDDANRLSSLYLWSAVSDAGAQRILAQLEAIARRPLVDIVPVYPQAQETVTDGTGETPVMARPNPIALRLEQVVPGTATPARTVLALRRQYGCFWITL